MTVGEILLIAGAVFILLGAVGWVLQKRRPEKDDKPIDIVENAADLKDPFNRVRYMDNAGKDQAP